MRHHAPQKDDGSLPLAGVRVLDFAQYLAGPVAALRLADLGADVIKIERPQTGDACRSLVINDQVFEGDSLLFHTFNRNKRSVDADLKSPTDIELVKALIADADVMIHNFRPGVMEKIGLDYAAASRINPRLVYGWVTGYGTTGPWQDKPGQDLLAQSLSGITWLSGNADDGPVAIGLPVLDIATAGNLVQGILALLVRRGVTGNGGLIEVDLLSSAIDLQFEQLTAYVNGAGDLPSRSQLGNANVYGAAPYGIYKTRDGYIAIAMTPLARLAELMELPQLGTFSQAQALDQRDTIKQIIATAAIRRDTADLLSVLEPAGIWCSRVMDWSDLARSDGFAALDPLQTVETANGAAAVTTRCPIRVDGGVLTSPVGAPVLGAHTGEVMDEVRARGSAAASA